MEGSDKMEFDALKKVTATVLGMDPEEITMDMTFLNDLGADLVKETNEYFIFTSICHGGNSSKL